jgi:hypothetical protein
MLTETNAVEPTCRVHKCSKQCRCQQLTSEEQEPTLVAIPHSSPKADCKRRRLAPLAGAALLATAGFWQRRPVPEIEQSLC